VPAARAPRLPQVKALVAAANRPRGAGARFVSSTFFVCQYSLRCGRHLRLAGAGRARNVKGDMARLIYKWRASHVRFSASASSSACSGGFSFLSVGKFSQSRSRDAGF